MLLDSFILLATRSHVFGPRNVNVSDPEYVEPEYVRNYHVVVIVQKVDES